MTTQGVTVPGAVEGMNGLLSVTGYGSITVRVERIRYAVSIASTEASARHGRAYYPGWLEEADFTLDLVHLSLAERDRFNTWMRTYMLKVTDGQLSHAVMLVQVPARKWVRRAIPMGSLNYGDRLAQTGKGYRTPLTFHGATDPIAAKSASTFKQLDPRETAPFFPLGTQKAGAEKLEASIFDTSAEQKVVAAAAVIDTSHGSANAAEEAMALGVGSANAAEHRYGLGG